MPFVTCNKFNQAVASLSTTSSTGLSSAVTANSAVASLSTLVGAGSAGLTSTNSAVASLSTIVATKADLVSGKVPATQLPSFVDDVLEGALVNSTTFNDPLGSPYAPEAGKIYTDTVSNKNYRWTGTQYVEVSPSALIMVKDEGTILTTAATELNFTGGGVTTTNSGGQVTVKVVGASASTVLSTPLAPTAPPLDGEPTKAVNTNGEVFEYVAGVGWVLVANGYSNLIIKSGTVVVPTTTTLCTHVVERTGVYQFGASFIGIPLQPPANEGKIYCEIRLNGLRLSIGVDYIPANLSMDGLAASTGTVSVDVSAGDVLTVNLQLFTLQTSLTVGGEARLSINSVK